MVAARGPAIWSWAEVLPGRRLGPREARVRERIGNADEPGAYSLIAIHNHAIPARFGAEALAEAAAATTAGRGAREDLRELALVTIDPAEARDHDDAVWARPDPARPRRLGDHRRHRRRRPPRATGRRARR